MECSSPFNLSLYIIKPPVVTNVSHLGHDLSLVQIVSLFLSKYFFFLRKLLGLIWIIVLWFYYYMFLLLVFFLRIFMFSVVYML
jgi:hypothetical protein